ncbi:unnamed protein product [Chironomus riparius]|uniref:Uncharacterized protein n=1 Tax=Chironomus riparius TaxID=315576 RepID=A0A9N9RTN2_9DIPT|nr:unnamed protein product [Chironomus riparius]
MSHISPYKLNNYTGQTLKYKLPIYCVKFCPFTDENIFAAAFLNKVEIYKIRDDDSIVKMRTFEAEKHEYFYALDWTIDEKTDEIVLIGAGMKGRIYNILETSIFGINVREETNAINEIVFNPKINYLFAAAHEDGTVCLYNFKSESCIAVCQTQRANSMKQSISVSFDPSGSYLAYGGMTKEIFIVNLKDCKDFQDNLQESLIINNVMAPVKLNLLHNMCVIQDLHVNFIDNINWYAESSVITKSANGNIIFWDIKGLDGQDIPFNSINGLKLVKQQNIIIENCDFWFIRFSVDPLLIYMSIGTGKGEFILYDLQNDSNSNWKCHTISQNISQATIRSSSFSFNGNHLVCCTDDGFLITLKKNTL